MKIAILGCKGTTLDLIDRLYRRSTCAIDLVITLPRALASRSQVSYYRGDDLLDRCAAAGIPTWTARSYSLTNSEDLAFFQKAAIDLLLVIGWERLLPSAVLGCLGKFAAGMHGSAFGLPRGRGRSPMNWALLTGQRKFVTYLFRYTPGIDDGDVIGFKVFDIHECDTIATLHAKNRLVMTQLIETYIPLIEEDEMIFWPQPPEAVSFYPKRTADDGLVDWTCPTSEIHRLVRAVGPPYPGAWCRWRGRRIILLEAQPYDSGLFPSSLVPGTIVDIIPSLGAFAVKTGDGSLLISRFTGVRIDALDLGERLGGGDQEATLRRIEERYPASVSDDAKEIRARP